MAGGSRTPLALLMVLLTLSVGPAMGLAQAPERVGTIVALEGTAYVLHVGHTASAYVSVQSPVYPGDIIQTGTASKIRLALLDGTVLTLGEQGTLRLTEFVYAPARPTRTTVLTIARGIFRVVAETLFPGARVEVTTPTAIAAIRGTDWMGEVKAESTAIVALQGRVAISHVRPEIRGTVILTPGMGTTVTTDQPPTPPDRWHEPMINTLREATALP